MSERPTARADRVTAPWFMLLSKKNAVIDSGKSFRRSIAVFLTVGSALVLGGCDSEGANSSERVAGKWHGSIETDSVTYQLSFDLQQEEEGSLSGPRSRREGELVGAEPSSEFQITNGSFTKPNFALSLTFRFTEVPRPILLEGTVGDEYREITADLSGGPPQFQEQPITLTRP